MEFVTDRAGHDRRYAIDASKIRGTGKNGRILNYQIIAPTTWNFSPRDAEQQPGALELALQDTEVGDETGASATIQHIIRSFDPCMVCTVH